MSHISRTFYFLFILLMFGATSARAEAIGRITKVQTPAQIGSANAAIGAPVHMSDRLRTGANGRIAVTFRDGSVLTLGENANVVIDRFVYDPQKSKADVVLKASRGALRFAGGKIDQVQHKSVVVNTPNAALAVRGTHFWVGPVNNKYGVLLLKGKLRVSKR
jgi:hypothetical protein